MRTLLVASLLAIATNAAAQKSDFEWSKSPPRGQCRFRA